jgi:hypothetical protein
MEQNSSLSRNEQAIAASLGSVGKIVVSPILGQVLKVEETHLSKGFRGDEGAPTG